MVVDSIWKFIKTPEGAELARWSARIRATFKAYPPFDVALRLAD